MVGLEAFLSHHSVGGARTFVTRLYSTCILFRFRKVGYVGYVERGSFWTAHHLHIFPCALD